MEHRLVIQRKYLEQIRTRQKIIEGRVWDKTIVNFQCNDIIIFHSHDDPPLLVRCRIIALPRYDNFHDMLQLGGYKNYLPDAETLEEAIAVYHGFPSYCERARRHGVVAIYLKLE